MTRRCKPILIRAILLAVCCSAFSISAALAQVPGRQQRPAQPRTAAPTTGQPLQAQPTTTAPRTPQPPANQGQLERPQATENDLRVEEVSPELERVLQEWSQQSALVKKLEGEHTRWVYDHVFHVEKWSVGYFYYEAPDKGRIDFREIKLRPENKPKRKDPQTNEPYAIQSDAPESWICNGIKVWQLKPREKTGEAIEIPPENRGNNIMNGPLPFLFGMPPEQAKKRYKLTLQKFDENDPVVAISVEPRLQADLAQYTRADLKLRRDNYYLPEAVRFVVTGGNEEKVFVFTSIKVNAKESLLKKWFGVGDPFEPPTVGWQITEHQPGTMGPPPNGVPPGQGMAPNQGAPQNQGAPPAQNVGQNRGAVEPQQPNSQTAGPRMPVFVQLNWSQTSEALKQLGIDPKDQKRVEFVRGEIPRDKQLEFVCYDQSPPPNTPLKPGQKITLTLYDRFTPPKQAAANQ